MMEEKALDCELLKELSTLQFIHAFPPQMFLVYSTLGGPWCHLPSL